MRRRGAGSRRRRSALTNWQSSIWSSRPTAWCGGKTGWPRSAGRWSCSTRPRRSRTRRRPRPRASRSCRAAAGIVLTGTPVENHLGDLWSLFDFCCPGLLGTASQFKKFVKRLNKQQDAQAFGGLRRLVRPYILRRLKTDPAIVPDLPEKTEMRTECGLSKKQAALYEQAVDELAKRLEGGRGHRPPRAGAVDADAAQADLQSSGAVSRRARTFAPDESGKFERLALLCEPIAERQEKVLVFTQFQSLTRAAGRLSGDGLRPARAGACTAARRSASERNWCAQFQDERRPAVLRDLAQGRRQRAEPDGRLARRSTSTAGGTRPSKTRPPTAPFASARSATCWSTSSSAAARSKNGSTP